MTELKDSGARQEFATGAVRDVTGGKGRMDLLPMRAMMEVSKLYEAGCLKYGDRNWERGINAHCYVDSLLRHTAKFMAGQNDEPHLVQACWNALCLLDTLLRIREGSLPETIYDLPMPLAGVRFLGDPAGPSETDSQSSPDEVPGALHRHSQSQLDTMIEMIRRA